MIRATISTASFDALWRVPGAFCVAAALVLLGTTPLQAQDEDAFGESGDDPFAESQLEEVGLPGGPAAGPGGFGLTVSGFVDVGYIHIAQSGPSGNGGDLSWAYGNSQFNYSSETDTYTVNEVDLTLRAERELERSLVGAVASIDWYPSRDEEIYQGGNGDRDYQVDQAFVWAGWPQAWNARVRLGRAPGVVVLEQLEENEAPDSRLIGHTYVYQAGAGYPYGVQAKAEPAAGLTIHLGQSNGGVGDYSFFAGDRSTTNRQTARDSDQSGDSTDKADGKTLYGTVDWFVFDEPAGPGTLRLGVAYANNPSLTYNSVKDTDEPYTFTNVYGRYKTGDYEARLEVATLSAYYEDSLGLFEASIASLLLSKEWGAAHLVTLRYEQMEFVSDIDAETRGTATKYGLTWRYRIADPTLIKLEYVAETQSPQFWRAYEGKDLTTNVLALSWIYSF